MGRTFIEPQDAIRHFGVKVKLNAQRGVLEGKRVVVDTPTREDLIASDHSVEAIREYITADTLGFLSKEGLYPFTGGDGEGFCDACFTGKYPLPVTDEAKPASWSCSRSAIRRPPFSLFIFAFCLLSFRLPVHAR